MAADAGELARAIAEGDTEEAIRSSIPSRVRSVMVRALRKQGSMRPRQQPTKRPTPLEEDADAEARVDAPADARTIATQRRGSARVLAGDAWTSPLRSPAASSIAADITSAAPAKE